MNVSRSHRYPEGGKRGAQNDGIQIQDESILILGVGNPAQGDDGAGVQAIHALKERCLPTSVQVEIAGLPGWGLPNLFEGWGNVILVDAVDMGQPPGVWKRFSLDEVKLWLQDDYFSLHQPDLACGLALADALGLLPEKLWLYGIQPAAFELADELSSEVSAGLPGMVNKILEDLENIH